MNEVTTRVCTERGRMSGDPHTATCAAGRAAHRRTHESYSICVDGVMVVIWADLQSNGWRPSWSGFNRTSAEMPYGGLEETRHRHADAALVAAFADVLPTLRVMRGRGQ